VVIGLTISFQADYDRAVLLAVKGSLVMTPSSKVFRLAMLAAVVLAGAFAAIAHHSFAMFDQSKQVTLNGTVTAFEWTNPHAYIEIDVPDEKGAVKHWSVELGSPSILMQSGWKYRDLKHGDKVTLKISPLKDGRPGGLLVQATLPDGRVLGNGPGRGPASPTTGAPNQ
jgi:hypothetical protein